ncbi:hypothetical protein CONLIGDRAFT_684100 [Coniochaeta ligniaria NRRL 30616]|uniref:Mg2+ transporter protein n=1 Tax=Coniochaeta ligniaria NRRL 30616 TaxID=1408157 RepID=A0A1J7ICV9_9PEZI|nr:hypothetical protein CONLIGDRAFT_684100 [Coniochaeta ligniaria NRRL 30616]
MADNEEYSKMWTSLTTGHPDSTSSSCAVMPDQPTILSGLEEATILVHSPEAEVNCFTLGLRLSLRSRNASGLLVVEAEKQLSGLREDVWASVQKLHASPLYFLSILLDHYSRRNEGRREYLDMRLVELEDKMGVCPFIAARQSSSTYPETFTDAEESIIHELHDNNVRLIWLSGTINFEILALDFAISLLDRFNRLGKAGSESPVVSEAMCSIMLEELRSMKSSSELRQFQRRNLQLRAEARIAMLYSRISQRDSKVSINVAEQSHRIAKTTREDSRVVRSIAVVSFMFLPATFVAAILSTGLFDFQPDELVVSKYWWVFVSFAVALTALVVLAWSLATPARPDRLRNMLKTRNL